MKTIFHLTPVSLLYLLSILLSLALSIGLSSQMLINKDGYLYLEAANAFSQGGLDAARSVYKWPFYSICIAWTQALTQLSFQHAAYLLNALLCALIVTAFINLIKALGGRFQEQVFAALIILLHTGFNDYRDYIIRDLGHWAFMLYGLYFLILYAQKRQLRFALVFGVSMLVAFLFRTEALFVMLFAPLVLLLPSEHALHFSQRIYHTMGAYTVSMVLAFLGLVLYFLGEPHMAELLHINPWLNKLATLDLLKAMNLQITQFRPAISAYIPDAHLYYVMFGGFFSYFLIRLFILLSPLYTLLSVYAICQQLIKPSVSRNLLSAYTAIYTLVVLGFLFYRFFLSGRYVMPVVLLLSLWAPFALSKIYNAWREHAPGIIGKRWCFPLVLVVLLYMLGDSLISSVNLSLFE